jgi:hypothetical protein
MLLRSGNQTRPLEKKKNSWGLVVHDTKEVFETWDQVHSALKTLARTINVFHDLIMHRLVCVKTMYLLLNNKKFFRVPMFQKILNSILKVLHGAINPPEYVARMIPELEQLQMSRIRWSIVRALVKFLSLHSRAVVTANHPSRIDFSIKED